MYFPRVLLTLDPRSREFALTLLSLLDVCFCCIVITRIASITASTGGVTQSVMLSPGTDSWGNSNRTEIYKMVRLAFYPHPEQKQAFFEDHTKWAPVLLFWGNAGYYSGVPKEYSRSVPEWQALLDTIDDSKSLPTGP